MNVKCTTFLISELVSLLNRDNWDWGLVTPVSFMLASLDLKTQSVLVMHNPVSIRCEIVYHHCKVKVYSPESQFIHVIFTYDLLWALDRFCNKVTGAKKQNETKKFRVSRYGIL